MTDAIQDRYAPHTTCFGCGPSNADGLRIKTVIEDGAFIGSDTQLVAPVTVGRGATVGAGSTVTKDAPPEALTVSRSRQTSIEGWKRPRKES